MLGVNMWGYLNDKNMEVLTRKEKIYKKKYIKPLISVFIIELENCIAVGSATVVTTDNTGDVYESWEGEVVRDEVSSW